MGVLERLQAQGSGARLVTMSVRFSAKDLERLDKAAEDIGTTRSRMIYEAVMDLVDQHEKRHKKSDQK